MFKRLSSIWIVQNKGKEQASAYMYKLSILTHMEAINY